MINKKCKLYKFKMVLGVLLLVFSSMFFICLGSVGAEEVFDSQLTDSSLESRANLKVLVYQKTHLTNKSAAGGNLYNPDENTFKFYLPQAWYKNEKSEIRYVYQNDNKKYFTADSKGRIIGDKNPNSFIKDEEEYTRIKSSSSFIELHNFTILPGMYFIMDLGQFNAVINKKKIPDDLKDYFEITMVDEKNSPLTDYFDSQGNIEEIDRDHGRLVKFSAKQVFRPGDLLTMEAGFWLSLDVTRQIDSEEKAKTSFPFTDDKMFDLIKRSFDDPIFFDGFHKDFSRIKVNGNPIRNLDDNNYASYRYYVPRTGLRADLRRNRMALATSFTGGVVGRKESKNYIKNIYASNKYHLVKASSSLSATSNTFYIRDFANDLEFVNAYYLPSGYYVGSHSNFYTGTGIFKNPGPENQLAVEVEELYDGRDKIPNYLAYNTTAIGDMDVQNVLKISLDPRSDAFIRASRDRSGIILLNFAPKEENFHYMKSTSLVQALGYETGSTRLYIRAYDGFSGVINGSKEVDGKKTGELRDEKKKIIVSQKWLGTRLNSSYFTYSKAGKLQGYFELNKANNWTKVLYIPEEDNYQDYSIAYLDRESSVSGLSLTTKIDKLDASRSRMFNERGDLLYEIKRSEGLDESSQVYQVVFENRRNLITSLDKLDEKENKLPGMKFNLLAENFTVASQEGRGPSNNLDFNIFEDQIFEIDPKKSRPWTLKEGLETCYLEEEKNENYIGLNKIYLDRLFDMNSLAYLLDRASIEGVIEEDLDQVDLNFYYKAILDQGKIDYESLDFTRRDLAYLTDLNQIEDPSVLLEALDLNRLETIDEFKRLLKSKNLNDFKFEAEKISGFNLEEIDKLFPDEYLRQLNELAFLVKSNDILETIEDLEREIADRNFYMLAYLSDLGQILNPSDPLGAIKDLLKEDSNEKFYKLYNLNYIKDLSSLERMLEINLGLSNSAKGLLELLKDQLTEEGLIERLTIDDYKDLNSLYDYLDLDKLYKIMGKDLEKCISFKNLKGIKKAFIYEDRDGVEDYIKSKAAYKSSFCKDINPELLDPRLDTDLKIINLSYNLYINKAEKLLDGSRPLKDIDFAIYKLNKEKEKKYLVFDGKNYSFQDEKQIYRTDKYGNLNFINFPQGTFYLEEINNGDRFLLPTRDRKIEIAYKFSMKERSYQPLIFIDGRKINLQEEMNSYDDMEFVKVIADQNILSDQNFYYERIASKAYSPLSGTTGTWYDLRGYLKDIYFNDGVLAKLYSSLYEKTKLIIDITEKKIEGELFIRQGDGSKNDKAYAVNRYDKKTYVYENENLYRKIKLDKLGPRIDVFNYPIRHLSLVKTDFWNNPLAGARFRLYRPFNEKNMEDGFYILPDGSQVLPKDLDSLEEELSLVWKDEKFIWKKDEAGYYLELISNKDGNLVRNMKDSLEMIFLIDGDYRLDEIRAPLGHKLNKDGWEIEVKEEPETIRLRNDGLLDFYKVDYHKSPFEEGFYLEEASFEIEDKIFTSSKKGLLLDEKDKTLGSFLSEEEREVELVEIKAPAGYILSDQPIGLAGDRIDGLRLKPKDQGLELDLEKKAESRDFYLQAWSEQEKTWKEVTTISLEAGSLFYLDKDQLDEDKVYRLIDSRTDNYYLIRSKAMVLSSSLDKTIALEENKLPARTRVFVKEGYKEISLQSGTMTYPLERGEDGSLSYKGNPYIYELFDKNDQLSLSLDGKKLEIYINKSIYLDYLLVNKKDMGLYLDKLDENKDYLPGAKFRLITQTEPSYPALVDGQEREWIKRGDSYHLDFESREARSYIKNLFPATYYLSEIKAPAGYITDSTEIEFILDEKDSFKEIEIINKKMTLPETGFSFKNPSLLGLILASFLVVAIYKGYKVYKK